MKKLLAGNYMMNYMSIGMALIFLFIFIRILRHGKVDLTESRKYIAVVEVLLMIALIGLGFYNIINIHLYPWDSG